MRMVRAGGHVLRGGRWVVETRPAAEPAPVVVPEPEPEPPPVDPEPSRVNCPDCGRNVAVNKDGSLRKHACTEE